MVKMIYYAYFDKICDHCKQKLKVQKISYRTLRYRKLNLKNS